MKSTTPSHNTLLNTRAYIYTCTAHYVILLETYQHYLGYFISLLLHRQLLKYKTKQELPAIRSELQQSRKVHRLCGRCCQRTQHWGNVG